MSDFDRADDRTESSTTGTILHRKATGGGGDAGTGSAVAAASLDAQDKGAGSPLEAGTRAQMEGAFGADFSDVRVHEGAQAESIGARAFAQGSDIHFAPGQYDPQSAEGQELLGHELAHVVQQRAGGGADADASAGGSGPGPGPTPQLKAVGVSSPGDAHEQAADRAGQAVARGEPVGDVGKAPAGVVSRDAIGDLRSAADGNWLGQVDGAAVITRTRALSAADKTALKTGDTYDALNRRVMQKLNTGQALEYLHILGGLDLRWKLYWLNEGGKLDELAANQWQWLVGYASPQVMDMLRQYPSGYRNFLNNAPLEMIPPWDRLQGLVNGTWNGSATDVRNAVVNLNPDQKAAVRNDNAKVTKILEKAGNAAEKFRVVEYLEFKVKWSIYWLNTQRMLPGLTQHQWSQLLSEATRADYDELVGWAEMWTLVQTHCPAGILQTTRQNSDPATSATAFDDPVQIDTMFSSLGPAGFLANATRNAAAVDTVYQKVQAKAKVLPTVEGLPKGPQMGAMSKANLRTWFFTPASTDAECTKMFEQRFRVDTTGAGTYDHTAGGTNAVNLQPFTKAGLSQMWTVCETLPPAHVENNPRLMNILRDQNRGPGSAYYAGPENGSQGDILMGYGNDGQLGQNVGGNLDNVYQAGGTGPGAPAVNMPMFNATLRHEIGHAVDASLKVMDTWGAQEVAGGWTKYASYTEFVDAIIAAAGGMNYGSPQINNQYRQAMIDAVSASPKISFSQACTNRGITPPAANPGGAVGVVWTPNTYSAAGSPWYNFNWVTVGGRNFQDAYDHPTSLYSFIAAQRSARMVTAYQWRAPGEWFAEAYQVYYSEQEAGVGTPVGGRLRSKDPEAAQMISQICDRGYSPQAMQGGTVAKAPGT